MSAPKKIAYSLKYNSVWANSPTAGHFSTPIESSVPVRPKPMNDALFRMHQLVADRSETEFGFLKKGVVVIYFGINERGFIPFVKGLPISFFGLKITG